MPVSPEKIKMFSLTESGSDSASSFPVLSQNEEEVRSKEKSPLNPASRFDENPDPSPNQEAHFNEKSSDNPFPSHEKNPNPCPNLSKEPVENPLQNPGICSGNHSHVAKKQSSFSHVEGGAEKSAGKKKATIAADAIPRKLPAWASASNQRAEHETGGRGRSEAQAEKMGNGFSLPRTLQEVIEAFSGDFDEKKYAEMDILEIAAIKGIVFENPPWWPPEGYPDTL